MRQQAEIVKDIRKIKDNHMEVCIFGCGLFGTGAGYDILEFLGIHADCFCDNDTSKWGNEIKEGIKCISPQQLMQKKNIACFVMVGTRIEKEIVHQIRKYALSIIITYYEITSLDIVIERFIQECIHTNMETAYEADKKYETEQGRCLTPIRNTENKEYVIYTCITGRYDQIVEPQYYSEECDYYLISDEQPQNLSVLKWIDINRVIPGSIKDNFRKNRFCKINAHKIFSEYRYSFYIDGNIQILGDIRKYVNCIGRSGIAAHALPGGDDLYTHALRCVAAKYDKKTLIFRQMADYYKEGMPRKYGMFECTILVRDNENHINRKIMEDWWDEVSNRSYRDQLSFTYCLWKNGLGKTDVGILGNNYRQNSDFRRTGNHHQKDGRKIQ